MSDVDGNARAGAPVDNEIATLLAYLRSQRRHVLGILEGLDEAALRRPVLPSGWSCLGMVQHLTVSVEHLWFRAVVAGEKDVIAGLDPLDEAWEVAEATSATEILDRYRTETALADAVIAASAGDDALAWWPHETYGEPFLDNVRDVVLHVIVETACHAGHLDAARELIDGRQWFVNT